MEIEEEKCQFCGAQAEHFLFAAFVCGSEECIEKARLERGGPGGHMKDKQRQQELVRFEEEKKAVEKKKA
jgi:hypothetical protein